MPEKITTIYYSVKCLNIKQDTNIPNKSINNMFCFEIPRKDIDVCLMILQKFLSRLHTCLKIIWKVHLYYASTFLTRERYISFQFNLFIYFFKHTSFQDKVVIIINILATVTYINKCFYTILCKDLNLCIAFIILCKDNKCYAKIWK